MALSPFAAHAATGVLEQVIVEAQKKVENVQDTPIAIQAMTGEQFQQSASFNLSELARSTPGLSFDTGVQTDIRLRGTSTVAGAPVSLRTNIYVDGALVEQPRAVFAAQYDISRFEILKGPQGTLYGKSSPTGTINIRTQNPNLTAVDGYVAGSAGERDLHNTQFGISLPIIENELGVRIAGVYDEGKSGLKDVTNGNEAQNRGTGVRFTTLWQPNDSFTGRLSYTYTEASTSPIYTVNGAGYRYYDDKATANFKDADFTRDQMAIMELTYNINDHLSLTSVTGYEDQHYTNNQDMDGQDSNALYQVPRPTYGVYNGLLGGDQQRVQINIPTNIQQDLRLASEDNDFWDWQVGGYYKYNSTNTPINVKKFSAANQSSVSIESAYVGKTEEFAAYTHNTLKFTDEFNLILGLRASRQRANSLQPTNGCLINGAAPADCTDNDLNLVTDVPALNANGIPLDEQMSYAQPITGTIKAQYFFSVDLAGYISFDRAYRTGASNLNLQGNIPGDFTQLGDEAAKSAEVGLKGSFWDQRARFSVAVFDQIYTDFQQDIQNVTVADPTLGTANANSFVVNAKEAEIRGVEAELTALVLDGWQLGVSMTYNDAKFNDFKNNPCTGTPAQIATLNFQDGPQYVTCDLSGEQLPLAPKWAGVITSNYTMPAPGLDGIDWYFNSLINAKSDQVDKVTRSTLGGYATVDLFTGLRMAEKTGWDVNVWLKNAFDRRVITRIFNSTVTNPDLAAQSPAPFEMVTTNAPRQLGVTGTYRF
ncbi:MAG TPA: TonB-dependent receptor [Spongiibacteraceae bacterium]|nr:TonB-dependent receptor [Spongiibacteraceae bacterium]